MTIGVAAARREHNFTALHYDAIEGAFSLRLTYEGHTTVSGRFTSPSIRLRFGAGDPYVGFADHATALRADGLAPPAKPRDRPTWWSEPISSGWGAQCVLSARCGGDPQDYATQQHYDEFLGALSAHDVDPGTLVIDDKWQAAYGGSEADATKWPDLRGWIDGHRAEGRHVLLWWKLWDPEGLPASWCVHNSQGDPLAVDPTNSDVRGRPPYEHPPPARPGGLQRRWDEARLFGQDALRSGSVPPRTRMGLRTAPPAVGDRLRGGEAGQARCLGHDPHPHPYFADVTDMIRLNDVNPRAPVVPQMAHRAQVVQAVCPQLLIDTDNWRMPEPVSFRAYVAEQPKLGVPSLYYATHLDDLAPWTKQRGHVNGAAFRALWAGVDAHSPSDGNHVEMTADDYRLIRRAWKEARSRNA